MWQNQNESFWQATKSASQLEMLVVSSRCFVYSEMFCNVTARTQTPDFGPKLAPTIVWIWPRPRSRGFSFNPVSSKIFATRLVFLFIIYYNEKRTTIQLSAFFSLDAAHFWWFDLRAMKRTEWVQVEPGRAKSSRVELCFLEC